MPLDSKGIYHNNDIRLPNTGKTFDAIRNKIEELENVSDFLTSTESEILDMLKDTIHLLDNPEDPF